MLSWLLFIFICAYWAPHFSNDYRYMLVEDTVRRAASLSDIVISQYRHYFEWGGRTVNHCLAMLVLMAPKWAEALVQALVYGALVLGIVRLSAGPGRFKESLSLKNIFIVTALLWLNLRYFGEVVFNVVSGANYLYSSLVLVLFLIPWADALQEAGPDKISFKSLGRAVRDKFALRPWAKEQAAKQGGDISFNKDPRHESRASGGGFGAVLKSLAFFIFGLIAGWTNENSGFALCAVLFLCLMLKKPLGLRFSRQHYAACLGLVAGFLFLILAPGNEERLKAMEEEGFDYASHVDDAFLILGESLLLFYAILGLLFFTLWKLKRHGALKLEAVPVRRALLCAAVGLLSLLVMLLSPTFPARASTFACVLLIAALLCLMHFACDLKLALFGPKAALVLVLAFVIYFLPTGQNCLQGYYRAHLDQMERTAAIRQARAQGARDLVVKSFLVGKSKYLFIADVRADEDYFSNRILERFYHLQSIRRECDPPSEGENLDFKLLGRVGVRSCTPKQEDVSSG